MSRSPFFYLEKYSKKRGCWEEITPRIKNKDSIFVAADLWPFNGAHDLFDILEGDSPFSGLKDLKGIQTIKTMEEFNQLSAEVQDTLISNFRERQDYLTIFGQTIAEYPQSIDELPNINYITYADLLIYCMQNPIVSDYGCESNLYNLVTRYDDCGNKILCRISCNENIIPTKPNPVQALVNRVKMFMDINDPWGFWEDDYSNIRVVYWIL